MCDLCCCSGTRGSNFSATGGEGGDVVGRGLAGDLPPFFGSEARTYKHSIHNTTWVCLTL